MSDNEKRELMRQMLESGIGKRYLDTQLSSCGQQGQDLVARIKSSDMVTAVAAGSGISFYGPASYDFSVLTMRSLLLADVTVQVVTMAGLSRSMEDWEFAKKLAGQDCLLITKFCDDGYPTNPLTSYQRFQLEDLLQERWDDNKPVFIQSPKRVDTYKDWWSPVVMAELKKRNDIMEVK